MVVAQFPLLCVILGLAASAQAQNSSSSSVAASSTSAASSPSSSASRTSITLPSYTPQASGAAYSNETAKALASKLPGYTYNLTEENLSTRTAICNQTTQFCASSKCTTSSANVTTNFCNVDTMGWNCQCNGGAASRLQPQVVPVNTYDCRLRTAACLEACQNPNATPRVNSTSECSEACNYVIGATCGTAQQQIPEYQVNSFADKPKYYPDTSKGGVAAGITTSFGSALAAPLVSLLACALGGGVWVLLG